MQRTKYEELIEPRLNEIKTMAEAGVSMYAISRHLGVCRTSLDRYRKLYPELDSILPNSKAGNKQLAVNQGGRPKTPERVKLAFREHSEEALNVLVSIMNDENLKAGDRIRAAEAILDRAWGKPYQAIQVDEQADRTINVRLCDEVKSWLC